MNCQLNKEQVEKMVAEYGSPLYIFHSAEFEENYLNLLNALSKDSVSPTLIVDILFRLLPAKPQGFIAL